eukprot:gnl/TRDRNA2_/TRDRNA2_173138_c0_seq1.p1 gnl/TRDRNA2_/TRDRNA2_173138_c0~~gnl/TRDRNA2_/TRDRNA2_173138_c0_seq1.p1  ORF type:complete len:621 (+),score=101.32 gnl/TRDRNA2_/TRDRNA2_173138_c0_seq1:396-2258(+)
MAKKDSRLVYVKFKREPGKDWSIGLKRNIGAHLATGEFIANFDDDDLYAPAYLSTMISTMEERRAQVIKLSSWYIHDRLSNTWGYCDPIAWGLTCGFDESAPDVRSWAYGYGFSYVFRRVAGLEVWYQDISFGEDFNFIMSVRQRRGERSVGLFHDDFGICLHIQHGKNTSDSIPLRSVTQQEALDLDIMELSNHFKGSRVSPASGLLSAKPAPSERRRSVTARGPDDCISVVDCAVSATVADFLEALSETRGQPCGALRVYRVPPRGEAAEAARDKVAADVLGIAFLAAKPGVEKHLGPLTNSGRQWRKLLEGAKLPMSINDRIGLRTTELWILPPAAHQACWSDEDDLGEPEEFTTVRVACQTSSAKQFFSNTFTIRLPAGACICDLRESFWKLLPESSKVFAEHEEGLVTLQDSDPLPSQVTVSEWKGNRKFYTRFSARQTSKMLRLIGRWAARPELQEQLRAFATAARDKETGEMNMQPYREALAKMLVDEVYPVVFLHLGLPAEELVRSLLIVREAVSFTAKDVVASTYPGSTQYDLWSLSCTAEALMGNVDVAAPTYLAIEERRRQAGCQDTKSFVDVVNFLRLEAERGVVGVIDEFLDAHCISPLKVQSESPA